MKPITIFDYSEKAFAVVGETKPIKEKLKELGGRWNSFLKCGAGWIFSKKKLAEVEAFLGLEIEAFENNIEIPDVSPTGERL